MAVWVEQHFCLDQPVRNQMYQSKRVTKVLLSNLNTVPGALVSLVGVVVLSAKPLRKYSEPSGNMQIRPKGGYYSYLLSRFTGPPGPISAGYCHNVLFCNIQARPRSCVSCLMWRKNRCKTDQKAFSKSYIPS